MRIAQRRNPFRSQQQRDLLANNQTQLRVESIKGGDLANSESQGHQRRRLNGMGRIACGAALVVFGLLCLSATARSDETDECETRAEPVTLALEETLGEETKAYLSLLANFGSAVTKEGVGPYPLAPVGEDKFGCKPLSPVSRAQRTSD